jgi:hypothetical protein
MKLEEVLGLLLGVSGIVVADIGFVGSAVTDLFHIGNPIPSVTPATGSNLLGSLLPPGGNTPLIFIGAGLLAFGMILLVLNVRALTRASIGAVPSK